MSNLRLVKKLSHLSEEQKHLDGILLDPVGLELTRGSLVELAGKASSGKTSLTLWLLSKLTNSGEICALVDSSDSFDPCTAVLAGVDLENLLWIKCGGDVEKAFMAADHLVQAKGFGAIWLKLGGLPESKIRMVPKTYWYRYRTRIKETPTIMVVTSGEHITGSASQQSFVFEREDTRWSGSGKFKLLREFHIKLHSRKQFYGDAFRTKIKVDYTDV